MSVTAEQLIDGLRKASAELYACAAVIRDPKASAQAQMWARQAEALASRAAEASL